ncbi:AraC family transcriptional regulator [Pleomorphomonas koreensis]|uniref:AraC family transcriptional regulator n=1 Tax=Pleomorphomonas koreensis TaxID=257440 RepID=UPI0003FDF321|nr:AraC family transcriptional regulator [Pleomorphomonas koreensis]
MQSAVMKDLIREVIVAPLDRGFLAFSHDYPYSYTGWHYHPEYELHLIKRSSGSFFVGTYAGRFEPDNLVLMGPNMPHMWVSDNSFSERDDRLFIHDRDMALQFSGTFADRCLQVFADAAPFGELFEQSHAGIEFSAAVSAEVAEPLCRLTTAEGPEKLALFFTVFSALVADKGRRLLCPGLPADLGPRSARLNSVLQFIAENYNRPDLTCGMIAEREGMPLSTFSRFFEKNLSCSCLEYINRLRIYKACQLLMETQVPITSICYDIGYDVLSTFNRNFTRFIGVSPSDFRHQRGLTWRLEPGVPLSAAAGGADGAPRPASSADTRSLEERSGTGRTFQALTS